MPNLATFCQKWPGYVLVNSCFVAAVHDVQSKWPPGFKLLDDPRLRGMLERQLFRVGYALGSWDCDLRLITQLDIPPSTVPTIACCKALANSRQLANRWPASLAR